MKLKSFSDLHKILPKTVQNLLDADNGAHDGKGQVVRIILETKNRRGKSVTVVEGLRHNTDTMKDIARILKERLGAGGSVKNGNIELQGDQRERASEVLRKMNYAVK